MPGFITLKAHADGLLTDPAMRSPGREEDGKLVKMDADLIVQRLVAMGAGRGDAVNALGHAARHRYGTFSLRAAGSRKPAIVEVWTPKAQLRDA